MKRIKMLVNWGYYKKGRTYDVSNWHADRLLKKTVDITNDLKIMYRPSPIAKLIKDLGRHIGNSKHIYLKNGRSEAYG